MDINDMLREEGGDAVRRVHNTAERYQRGPKERGMDSEPARPADEPRYVDNARAARARDDATREPRVIIPTTFVWRDPKTVPPRAFIMGRHYIRRYAAATIATGGRGKSALVTVDALALATGKRLIGIAPRRPMVVWYIGEDDREELERRFLAAMRFYGLKAEDVGGRLLMDSFRDIEITVAHLVAGAPVMNIADVEAIIAACRVCDVDVLMVDPLVKTHRVPENDNPAMNLVYTAWVNVAERARCAVELVVHSRKGNAGQAGSIEDIRGASSQTDALRDARLIVRMTEDEATALGIEPKDARHYIRIGDTKANMTPPSSEATEWFRLESVCLDNGISDDAADEAADNVTADSVQVVTRFSPPALFDDVPWGNIDAVMRALKATPRRENAQAADWAGHLVGELLDIDTGETKGKARVKAMLTAWRTSGALKVVRMPDSHGDERPFLTLGKWDFRTPHATSEAA
jgi:hypothetical protein